MKYRVIIAGSRNFNNYPLLKQKCDNILKSVCAAEGREIQIVSGTCFGADKLGERYAKERGYEVVLFPAPWDDIKGRHPYAIGTRQDGKKFWKGAGNFRNHTMAKNADAAIIFSVNNSGGSANMRTIAENEGLKVRFINVK